jgi:hypothetical protein
MSIQNHSRKWKPQRWNVGYNRVDPSCRWSWEGLVLAWPLWDTGYNTGDTAPAESEAKILDPICGQHGYPIGFTTPSVEFVGGHRGTVARSTFGNPARISTRPENFAFLPTGAATVIFHYRKTDSTARNSAAFGPVIAEGAGPTYFAAYLPYGDGNIYYDFGGNSGNNRITLASGGYDMTADNVWAFTNGPRGMEIWLSGARIATNGGVPVTRTQITSASVGFGIFHGLSSTNDSAESGAFLIYDRQLSERSLVALMLDPWTPFRPWRKPRGLSFAAPAGGARSFVPAIIG